MKHYALKYVFSICLLFRKSFILNSLHHLTDKNETKVYAYLEYKIPYILSSLELIVKKVVEQIIKVKISKYSYLTFIQLSKMPWRTVKMRDIFREFTIRVYAYREITSTYKLGKRKFFQPPFFEISFPRILFFRWTNILNLGDKFYPCRLANFRVVAWNTSLDFDYFI